MPSRVTDTLWEIPPHTQAKLDILRFYLGAWFPIVASLNSRIVYLDAFAGPGRYLGGEDGSPVVALKAALERQQSISARLSAVFLEERKDRKEHLDALIAAFGYDKLADIGIEQGTFRHDALRLVDAAVSAAGSSAPLFSFIDPFNWDIPFSTLRRLLAYPMSEVFVNFMFDPVRRFLSAPQQADNWDQLFGTPAWREILDDADPDSRSRRIPALYRQQLREAGARHVLAFEMRDARNTTDYYLFFATKSDKGLLRMKEAMWRVDRSGSYCFRDPKDPNQPLLVGLELGPNFPLLRGHITGRFGGTVADIEEIERFVLEETAFLPSHLRRPVLAPMEQESPPGLRVVSAKPGRKRGQFPAGTKSEFP